MADVTPDFQDFRSKVSSILLSRINDLEILKKELESEVMVLSGTELDKTSNLLIATVGLLDQFKTTSENISKIP